MRIRVPDAFDIGEESIVDDWCYFSTRIRVGRGSHIATCCSVAGGSEYLFSLGDYSSLSAGVRVWCSSNDFVRDVIAITVAGIGDEQIAGDVAIGDYTGIGANTVVMPDNRIPEGVAVGALSFVPPRFEFEPWTVYAGTPIAPVGMRDRGRVLDQVARLRALSGGSAGA